MLDVKNKNGVMTIGAVIASLIALITGIASITKPLQYQMEALEARLMRVETRIGKNMEELDAKLQLEISGQSRLMETNRANLQQLQEAGEVRSKVNTALIDERYQENNLLIRELMIKVAKLEVLKESE